MEMVQLVPSLKIPPPSPEIDEFPRMMQLETVSVEFVL
jgi:hypothetical protein